MIQETVLRLENIDVASPIVICNESHRFIVADQLAQINVQNPFIILEPLGRNTAPAIAAGAFKAQAMDKDAVMVVLPSDHVIQNKDVLAAGVELACKTAAEGFLVTFGITPTAPETGYGYIKAQVKNGDSVFTLDRFVEKPNRETAQKYLDSGEYFWNSGMFVFKASTFLAELQEFEPEIFASVEAAYTKAAVDVDFIRLEK
jgi:mannose-1-phosphate guanylyltransferase/mannose-6-phosphate isomerase